MNYQDINAAIDRRVENGWEYNVNDRELSASVFIPFVNKIWPGNYDPEKTQSALSRTRNITVYDGNLLVGCLRILTDGYFSVPLRSFWSFRNTKTAGSAASCFGLPEKAALPCFILARSPGWKHSMKKTAVKRECSPI